MNVCTPAAHIANKYCKRHPWKGEEKTGEKEGYLLSTQHAHLRENQTTNQKNFKIKSKQTSIESAIQLPDFAIATVEGNLCSAAVTEKTKAKPATSYPRITASKHYEKKDDAQDKYLFFPIIGISDD